MDSCEGQNNTTCSSHAVRAAFPNRQCPLVAALLPYIMEMKSMKFVISTKAWCATFAVKHTSIR